MHEARQKVRKLVARRLRDGASSGHGAVGIPINSAAASTKRTTTPWARQVALPFWQNQQGFRAIRGYYTLVGGGARIVAQVDFDHWDSLATVMASDGYMRQRHELTTFANDIDSRVLVPTGRTPQ